MRSRALRLEETVDGGRTWLVVPGLPRVAPEPVDQCNSASRGLAEVAAVRTDGGGVFVVTMRRDGLARRTPDGRWQTMPGPLSGPSRRSSPVARLTDWIGDYGAYNLIALGLVFVGWALVRRQSRRAA